MSSLRLVAVGAAAFISCTPTTKPQGAEERSARSSAPDQAAPPPAGSAAPAASATAASAGSAAVRPDEWGPPEPVRVDVIAKICAAAPCSGEFARLRVFYLPQGIHRYAHDGDIRRCSHPPTTVYDREGKEVGAIPLEPIVPGSARDKELAAKQRAIFGEARHVTTFDCQGRMLSK